MTSTTQDSMCNYHPLGLMFEMQGLQANLIRINYILNKRFEYQHHSYSYSPKKNEVAVISFQ